MEKVKFLIEVPLPQEDDWFVLCECQDATSAGAVVVALLDVGPTKPLRVRVTKVSYFVE